MPKPHRTSPASSDAKNLEKLVLAWTKAQLRFKEFMFACIDDQIPPDPQDGSERRESLIAAETELLAAGTRLLAEKGESTRG